MACPMYVKTLRHRKYRIPEHEDCKADGRVITNESSICLHSCDKCYLYQRAYPRRGHCPDPPTIIDPNKGEMSGGFIIVVVIVGFIALKYFRII